MQKKIYTIIHFLLFWWAIVKVFHSISMAEVTKKIMSSRAHEQIVCRCSRRGLTMPTWASGQQMVTLLGRTRPHQGSRAFDQQPPTHSATDCVCFRPPLPDCSHEFRRASHISRGVHKVIAPPADEHDSAGPFWAARGNMEELEELIGASSQRVRNKPHLAMEKVTPQSHLIAIETNTWCCGTGQDRRHACDLSAPLVLLHIRDRETADGRGIALKELVLARNTYKDARPTNHSVSV